MKVILKWYMNLPIRQKLLIWFVPLFMLTIAITGFTSYQIATDQVFSKVNQNQENLLKKSIDQLNLIDQEVNDFANYLFLSSSVQELLDSDEPSPLKQQTYSSLSKMMVTRPIIQSLIIYSLSPKEADQQPLAINQTGITSAKRFTYYEHSPLFDSSLLKTGESDWHLLRPENSLFIGDSQSKVLKSRILKNSNSLKNEGIVVIGINANFLRGNYLTKEDPETQMFILDDNGMILTSSTMKWVGKNYRSIPALKPIQHTAIKDIPSSISSDEWIIGHSHSDSADWNVIIVQSKKKVLKELNQIQWITFFVMVLCFIGSIFVSLLAASHLTKPLQKLILSMKEVEKGDFSQSVAFSGEDEIGQLGKGYDQMIERVQTLIHDVYHSKLKQRDAELKALQSQIHPHFLYNTLNTICWTAKRKGEHEIADMTYALSKVFRLILNDGRDFIDLKSEIELVENYLYLQGMRFKPNVNFEISIEPGLENMKIPNLLIQPFVENAIIHGIEPSNESGFISVRAFTESGHTVIEIADNGIGISASTLTEINRPLKAYELEEFDRKNGTGYAIHNVKERLMLVYGNGAALHFYSHEGTGSRAEIRLTNLEGGISDVQIANC
ncbi:cache domain-containing sensor histidine kinase [Metabacillus sp. RGM 3146]|uniref:cache domain-containing sensor histidine kinase n=1 Tax=Metabacillus sp. RGM 3146 TaxID=3401092 RepID=UPI003B99D7B2